jgi:hypothetical protein
MTDQPTEPVEPDDDDTGDGTDTDDDREPIEGDEAAPPATPDGPSLEAKLNEAGKATIAYHKKLTKILGDDADRHECPTCEGIGVVWGEQPTDAELVHPENLVTCDACAGWGRVLTGSKNPEHITAICTACAANGFITRPAAPAAVAYLPPAAETAPQTVSGQMIPGVGFVPFGESEPIPGTNVT